MIRNLPEQDTVEEGNFELGGNFEGSNLFFSFVYNFFAVRYIFQVTRSKILKDKNF
jgi:hypothetical protein